ncbi:MAG: TIGR01777 family protein [Methyloprofundus sp.]|nr:TIGR01777 family protein [Methyloprofundus sp.]
MKILITGGTGFIGKKLCLFLLSNGHELTVLSRKPKEVPLLCGESVQAISNIEQLTGSDSFDAIINLAGEGIANSRWTDARKQVLLDSRINTTKQLLAYIRRAKIKPEVLISGSAVGYYGNRGSKVLNEKSDPHEDFAHELCEKWETVAREAEALNVRVCIIRTGLVIGEGGGFLKRMLPPFKFGLGGPMGSGQQWMSWIHITDLIAIIDKLLISEVLQGTFNATAPNPVSNAEFSQTLANILNRPAFLPIPTFVLEVLFGEMAELLIGGQRVVPERIEHAGYEFQFKTLGLALMDVLVTTSFASKKHNDSE